MCILIDVVVWGKHLHWAPDSQLIQRKAPQHCHINKGQQDKPPWALTFLSLITTTISPSRHRMSSFDPFHAWIPQNHNLLLEVFRRPFKHWQPGNNMPLPRNATRTIWAQNSVLK